MRRRVYVHPEGHQIVDSAAFFQAPLPLTIVRSSLKRCTDSGENSVRTSVRRHLRHHTRLGVLDSLDRWQANDLLWCDEERRFVKVLCNCSRIERLERLRVLPKGFKNSAVFIVLHIPSIRGT